MSLDMLDVGQANELKLAFRRNDWTNEEVKRLCEGDILARVRSVLLGNAEIKPLEQIFKRDMRKEGWKLISNKSRRIQSISDMELVTFLKSGENYVGGEKMLCRATEAGNDFSQEDAEWLLAHQSDIPEEWRNYYLIFPGTIWQRSDGYRSVPGLGWSGDGWCLSFDWLDDDWRGHDRLLSLRK